MTLLTIVASMERPMHFKGHLICEKTSQFTTHSDFINLTSLLVSPWGKYPEIRSPWTLLWSSLAYLQGQTNKVWVFCKCTLRRGKAAGFEGTKTREELSQLWLSSLPESVPGGYMACRHQSQWQLLISPLHKRLEIIRMDQSSGISVSVCVCEGAGGVAGGGSSWDPMNTNQPQGKKGLWLLRCAPASAWLCVFCACRDEGVLDWQARCSSAPTKHLLGLTND